MKTLTVALLGILWWLVYGLRWILGLVRIVLRAFGNRKYLFRLGEGDCSKKRRNRVKNLWLAMGCIMLMVGQLAWIVVLLLLTVFASFMILDEAQ